MYYWFSSVEDMNRERERRNRVRVRERKMSGNRIFLTLTATCRGQNCCKAKWSLVIYLAATAGSKRSNKTMKTFKYHLLFLTTVTRHLQNSCVHPESCWSTAHNTSELTLNKHYTPHNTQVVQISFRLAFCCFTDWLNDLGIFVLWNLHGIKLFFVAVQVMWLAI